MSCSSFKNWIKSTNFLVYCTSFSSSWSEQMWMFAIGVFLIKLSPESLRLTATYGLILGVSVLLFAPVVGEFVDRNNRLYVARITLIVNKSLVILTTIIILLLFQFNDDITAVGHDYPLIKFFYALIILVTVASNLASVGNKISIQRDWVAEICINDTNSLAVMMAAIRRIDLFCRILAPLVTGQIMEFASAVFTCIFLAACQLVSVLSEYVFLYMIYKRVPALADKEYQNKPDINHKIDETTTSDKTCCNPRNICSNITRFLTGWTTYMKYTVAWAGGALAFLYMTAIAFDNITIGYSHSQGVSESLIGILIGACALVGIIGTFAYPHIRRTVGLERTGLFSFAFQMSCVTLCVISVWVPGSSFDPLFYVNGEIATNCSNYSLTNNEVFNTTIPKECDRSSLSIILLLTGITAARFGLWITDLTITQLQLEIIDQTERGIVNGVQFSLNQFMELIKFSLVVALPHLQVFGYIVMLSYAFGLTGFFLYGCYTYRIRSHVLPHCCKPKSSLPEPVDNRHMDIINNTAKRKAKIRGRDSE